MRHLLDVNVVLAIIDPAHEHHAPATRWFNEVGRSSFATCPIVENGVIRIAASSAYPNRPGDVDTVRRVVDRLCDQPGHAFWADSVSLRTVLSPETGLTPRQVTDVYLLALAVEHRGRLATFDRRIPVGVMKAGSKAVVVLPT